MELKRLKAITPSQRNLIMLNRVLVSNRPCLKKEIYQLKKMAGRNNEGKIVTRHKGGGHKKKV
jgi:large subunit ribosomal protein L2